MFNTSGILGTSFIIALVGAAIFMFAWALVAVIGVKPTFLIQFIIGIGVLIFLVGITGLFASIN